VLVGRSFRSETDLLLPARSGLQNKSSDWIVAGTVTPIRGVNAFVRTRYAPDQADNKFRRIEAGVDAYRDRANGSIRYIKDQQDAGGTPLETFEMRGQLNLTKKWGITAYGQNDLVAGVWRRRDLGVVYNDDCIRIDVIYQNEDRFSQVSTGGLKLKSDESITFRLSFATLGDTGYND
jgi:LPS-assembly protein